MRGSVRILRRDLLRLVSVPAAWIVIIGLAFVPALYAWFNIVGFWDPYNQTSRIRVAVANEDEGWTREPIGFVNVGAMLQERLEDNDQLGWHFVSADQARAEVERGDSYAAFVIPADFSKSLTGVVDGTFTRPDIAYYVNEKNNAVAPKITRAGATTLDNQINSAFVATVARTLSERVSEAGASLASTLETGQSELVGAMGRAASGLGSARSSLEGLDPQIEGAKASVSTARTALSGIDGAASSAEASLGTADQLVSDARTSLSSFSSGLSSSLDGLASQASQAAAGAASAGGALDGGLQGAAGAVGGLLGEASSINTANGQLLADLQGLPIASDPAVSSVLGSLSAQNTAVGSAITDLTALNSSISGTSTAVATALDSMSSAASAVSGAVSSGRAALDDQVPAISSALDQMAASSAQLRAALATARSLRAQVSGLLDQMDSLLDGASAASSQSAANLGAIESDLSSASTDIQSIASSNSLTALAASLGVSPEAIAAFVASPTSIQTEAVFPVAAYGSAMAPLFTNLALWVGAFSLVILFKLEVDEEGTGPLTSAQKYLGRWMLLAVFAVAQALVVSAGDLVIGVQTASRTAFVGTAVLVSLAFLSIIYMLATCLQHIGKGLCVIIVVVQIPGAAGLYPIEMMPSFFRALHPALPFTYGINALRETVGGFYGNHYVLDIGVLGAHTLIAFAIGLALRPHLVNLNAMMTRELSQSGLFVAEATRVPSSRYRLTQIISVLADHEGYQRGVARRIERFERRYPAIKRGGLAAGIVVPAVLAVLSVTNAAEVPIVLGAWIVWLLLVILFLVGVEYLREALDRQRLLSTMGESDVRSLLRRRAAGARARVMAGAAAVTASLASVFDTGRSEAGEEEPPHGADAERAGEDAGADGAGGIDGGSGSGGPSCGADSCSCGGADEGAGADSAGARGGE